MKNHLFVSRNLTKKTNCINFSKLDTKLRLKKVEDQLNIFERK